VIETTSTAAAGATAPPPRRPLEGVRVLDFTIVWAGPMCAQMLADLGAEVIKIEATTRMDPERGAARVAPGAAFGGRRFPGGDPGERPYNRGGRFHEYNRGKLGLTINLKHPDGPALVRDLVRVSDFVVENFSAGTLDRLGFGYDDLVKLRPDIILMSMQGFGSTGPEAENVGYGPTQEAMSGLSAITGYAGGPPLLTGVFYGDPVGGTFSAAAAVMALWRRQQTGQGAHIDVSQQEMLLSLIPEVFFEYQFNGRVLGPAGNRDPACVPQGCYPCDGEDAWLAMSVQDDEQWCALCGLMGRPDLIDDEGFATHLARLRRQDEIDEIVAAWTKQHEHHDLMHRLQAAGIPAEAVLNVAEVLADPHYAARGFFQPVHHVEVGTYPHSSAPWRLESGYLPIQRGAPCLGEHNAQILGGLLGLSEAELARLEAEGVIGTEPPAG